MTKSKAQQAILDLRAKFDELPKVKHMPKGMGFSATRTKLKNKFYFLKLYKTDHSLNKLLVEQATKDIEGYTIEVYKIRDRKEAEKAEKKIKQTKKNQQSTYTGLKTI